MVVGLTGAHGKAHVYRAMLEGLAFEQRLLTDGAEAALDKPLERIIVARRRARAARCGARSSPTSCGARSRRQRGRVDLPRLGDARGGRRRPAPVDPRGGRGDERHRRGVPPDEGRAQVYDRLYGSYREIYPRLKDVFAAMNEAGAVIAED